ncbi:MAG: nitroreductase family protein [candidate division Zixibacteria bacterium]|nr:nitroreductase family protein [candidate division Zixibacteria bacterium]
MKITDTLSLIKSRRSIRKYREDDIPSKTMERIMEAGRWAPSGLNNQPWKFCVIKDSDIKKKLSVLTAYGRIVRQCRVCIAVFYDLPRGYDRDKDAMAIGACVQNMLLASVSLGIGSVWLGEILNRKKEVNALLDIDDSCELMAVIALGYPAESPKSSRRTLKSFILKKI